MCKSIHTYAHGGGCARLSVTVRDQRRSTGELLAELMQERGLSKAALARILAGDAEHSAHETWRRKIYHYLGGGDPKEATARLMEKRLSLPEGHFPRSRRKLQEDPVTLGERMLLLEVRQGQLADAHEEVFQIIRSLQRQLRALARERAQARPGSGDRG